MIRQYISGGTPTNLTHPSLGAQASGQKRCSFLLDLFATSPIRPWVRGPPARIRDVQREPIGWHISDHHLPDPSPLAPPAYGLGTRPSHTLAT